MGATSRSATQGETLNLHASAVAVGETGILIRGRSGAGKSSLSIALIALWLPRPAGSAALSATTVSK